MTTHLDLFSGIGGWALAARMVGGIRTVGFCEIEPFPRRVLANHWPGVPIHDDITTLTADIVRGWAGGSPDLITASYPCQGFSVAGQRRGEEDDRFLWPHVARLAEELRPRLLVAENVAGHVSLGLDRVLAELEGLDYTGRAIVVPACAVGALHRRDRVWILAHRNDGFGDDARDSVRPGWDAALTGGEPLADAKGLSRCGRPSWGARQPACCGEDAPDADGLGRRPGLGDLQAGESDPPGCSRALADTDGAWQSPGTQGWDRSGHGALDGREAPADAGCQRCQAERISIHTTAQYTPIERRGSWPPEPGMGGSPDGVSAGVDGVAGYGFWDGDWERGIPRTVDPRSVWHRVARIKSLGNAIVPQVAAEILRVVTGQAA